MSRASGILHVYAHPDDESFGNPATIALYASRGVPMSMVTMTRGDAGDSTGRHSPEDLGRIREGELRAACEVLGISRLEVWDYPDGRLAEAGEEAVARLAALCREVRPEVIVTYGDDGTTGHPDHLAVSRWAGEAFFRLRGEGGGAPPARLYWRAVPAHRREKFARSDLVYRTDWTTILDARDFGHVREAAESCHASQRPHTDYSLPALAGLGAVDYYVRVFPEWKGGPPESGLMGEPPHPEGTILP
ncbi:MAG: PIG-L family deacetylase [bacterium]